MSGFTEDLEAGATHTGYGKVLYTNGNLGLN